MVRFPRALRPALGALLVFALHPLDADIVRGLVKSVINVTSDPDSEQTVELHYQEFVAVALPADARFLEGLQVQLVLSAEAKRSYDDFALVIYDRLEGPPTAGMRSTTGRRAFLQGLLSMNRLFYVVSFTGNAAAQSDNAQGVFGLPEPAAIADFPVLIGVLPVAKGIPDAMQELVFYLRCRPVVRAAGTVTLKVMLPAGPRLHQFTVLVDDAPLDGVSPARPAGAPWESTIELPAGLHSVRVTSPTLQQAQATFSVDPGGTSVVELQLRETAAHVTFEAPRDTAIYLDGNKIDYPRESRVGLPVGEHTIRFRLGDFSGTRSFTVAEGKSYTVYLELNVSVKED